MPAELRLAGQRPATGRGVIAHAVVVTEGAEIAKAFRRRGSQRSALPAVAQRRHSVPLVGGLEDRMERSIIDEVIQRCRGNKAATARALGMHRRTLYRLLEDDEPGQGRAGGHSSDDARRRGFVKGVAGAAFSGPSPALLFGRHGSM